MYKKAFLALSIGILFLAASILASLTTAKNVLNGISTTALVLEVKTNVNYTSQSTKNSLKLEYQCGDSTIRTSWTKPSSTYHEEGSELRAFCNPNDPEDIAIIDGTVYGFVAFLIFSILIVIWGIFLLKKAIKISAKKKKLKEIWTPILLEIDSLKATWAVINNKREYLIKVNYKGEILTSDEPIYYQPNNWKITVYINTIDPSEYWIDTKSIIEEE